MEVLGKLGIAVVVEVVEFVEWMPLITCVVGECDSVCCGLTNEGMWWLRSTVEDEDSPFVVGGGGCGTCEVTRGDTPVMVSVLKSTPGSSSGSWSSPLEG